MTRITTYVLVALTVVIITASYGSEVSQELVRRFQNNPEKTCELIAPIAHVIGGLTVPIGAQHKKETVWRETAPEGFHAVLALMQGVSVAPCELEPGEEATISIRAIRLIERDPETGTEAVVSEVADFDADQDFRFDGELYPRTPTWYAGGPIKPQEDMLSKEAGTLIIDLDRSPRHIFHGWTDPKVEARPGMNYLVEIEAAISSQARLQMGIDYWREASSAYNTFDSTCATSNNCEGHLSQWFGETTGFQTLRSPLSLQEK